MIRQGWILFLVVFCISLPAQGRDTEHKFPISDVFERDEYASRIEDVAFYFAGQTHPKVVQRLGEYQSNKKTNAFNKSDRNACAWVFLSALISLHDRALAEGGNAVINIRSNYKKRKFSSPTEYMCGAGAIMAGVTLKGEVVELGN